MTLDDDLFTIMAGSVARVVSCIIVNAMTVMQSGAIRRGVELWVGCRGGVCSNYGAPTLSDYYYGYSLCLTVIMAKLCSQAPRNLPDRV